jgi:hypothetical protein
MFCKYVLNNGLYNLQYFILAIKVIKLIKYAPIWVFWNWNYKKRKLVHILFKKKKIFSGNIKTWTENKIIKDNGTKEMYN